MIAFPSFFNSRERPCTGVADKRRPPEDTKRGSSRVFSLVCVVKSFVNGPLSLCMPIGVGLSVRACCEVRNRRGSVFDLNSFA